MGDTVLLFGGCTGPDDLSDTYTLNAMLVSVSSTMSYPGTPELGLIHKEKEDLVLALAHERKEHEAWRRTRLQRIEELTKRVAELEEDNRRMRDMRTHTTQAPESDTGVTCPLLCVLDLVELGKERLDRLAGVLNQNLSFVEEAKRTVKRNEILAVGRRIAEEERERAAQLAAQDAAVAG
eukprot:CAMPEP_0119153262 /NCGR_PEP_ID=MMETSP1310-20130426/48989_1 /TAXON_ID=464262 /ORGANISM="Genus nov. species nov., Strain RCC2339" /LENGTH=179 /DNA_ID=CAMNT_0007145701 /DNA_START=1 /DNA_END=536 /DNA_ORIENTATION=+